MLERRDGEPSIPWVKRRADYRGVHSCVFPSWYWEGWESNLDKCNAEPGVEILTVGIGKNRRFSVTPPGLKANYFLCRRVHATYDIWLEYLVAKQHEAATRWLQDGQGTELWVWKHTECILFWVGVGVKPYSWHCSTRSYLSSSATLGQCHAHTGRGKDG